MANEIPILLDAIAVVEAVAKGREFGSAAQMARSLGIASTSCFRILKTLESVGWVLPKAGGGFELSAALAELFGPLDRFRLLIEASREALAQLALGTQMGAKLTVRQGHQAVTIARAEAVKPVAVTGRIGLRLSLALGSSGAVLAMQLPDAELRKIAAEASPEVWQRQTPGDFFKRVEQGRKEGLCLDCGSYAQHLQTMSVPVMVSEGQIIGAVTLMGFAEDFAEDRLKSLKRNLGSAVEMIQQRYRPSVPVTQPTTNRRPSLSVPQAHTPS